MSTLADDILSARSEVLENKCNGPAILSDNCHQAYSSISTDRANKFYKDNMSLECRKNFNHKNCKDFIIIHKDSGVASFVDNYCGKINTFLSKDCYLACGGDLRSVLTMCPYRINIFLFIMCIIAAVMIFLFKANRYVSTFYETKKII